MDFNEWHALTYHPDFGKEHREWEEKAWNAAIEQAVEIASNAYWGGEYKVTGDKISGLIKKLKVKNNEQ